MKLKELLTTVAQRWPFNEKNYPVMQQGGIDLDANQFARRHVLFHLQKELGKLAELYQYEDHHTRHMAMPEERRAIRDLLICTLRLASINGMTADELLLLVQGWADAWRE